MKFSLLAQISHKICPILMIFFLSGCIGYVPNYLDDNVEFTIHGLAGAAHTDDKDEIHVYVDDKEIEFKKEKKSGRNYTWRNLSSHKRQSGKEILYCSTEEYENSLQVKDKFFYDIHFKVKRERQDKIIKITRSGKPDTVFSLHHQITDEKWAESQCDICYNNEKSAAILLLPTNTYAVLVEAAGITPLNWIFLPLSIPGDIYNLVIGLPSTAIINPWTNYQIHQQNGETCLWVDKR